jgi:hypothetical protein
MSTRALICGGGVNGAAIAYLRSRREAEAIFIDRPRLAARHPRFAAFRSRPISLSRPQAATQEPDDRMRGTFD